MKQGEIRTISGMRAVIVSSDEYNDTSTHVFAMPLIRKTGGPPGHTVALGEQDPFSGTVDVFALDRVPRTVFGPAEGYLSGATMRSITDAVAGLFAM